MSLRGHQLSTARPYPKRSVMAAGSLRWAPAMEALRTERLARSLIQAMEPSFRSHLGDRATDRDFIGDLYLGLRRALTEYGDVEVCAPTVPRGIVDELALTAYLVAASRGSGARVDPELLESLRSAITRVLTGANRAPAAEEGA